MKLSFLLKNFTTNSFIATLIFSTISYSNNLIDNTIETGENFFSPVSFTVFSLGSIASFATYKIENTSGNSSFLPNKPFATIDRIDNFLFAETLPIVAGSVWIAGKLSSTNELESFGEELSIGLFYSYGIVQTLKWSFNRERPNGENNNSFPSAHSAGTACLTSVLWHNYGAKIGIPAAAIALYTCLSRVNMGKHFPSDVIMGAAIGTASGIASFSVNQREETEDNYIFPISLKLFLDTSGRLTVSL